MIETGQKAPDFIAPAAVEGAGEMVQLAREVEHSDAVVLLFYPADFVPAVTAELCAVRDAWADESGLSVLAVGGDSLFAHTAYADRYDLPFPLVTDYRGGVADSYGLLADEWESHHGIPRRATVVVGGDWTVRFVDALDDAHDRASPAPAERAVEAIGEAGIEVRTPTVEYDSFSE